MAIKYLAGGRISLLSTDAKPEAPIGTVYTETDTGDVTIAGGGFESLQEAWGNTQRPQQMHFVYWFSGSDLNTNIWNAAQTSGTTTRGMSDSIDGGYYIHGGGAVNRVQYINFGNKELYNAKGSVHISVCKDTGGQAKGAFFTGFMEGMPSAVGDITSETNNHAGHYKKNERYNKVSTSDGTTESSIEIGASHNIGYTGVTWHVYRTELKPATCEFSIDGIHVATKTLNLPAGTGHLPNTHELQPTFSCYHDGGEKDMHIRYMECYNSL